jgi:hypothetical protein
MWAASLTPEKPESDQCWNADFEKRRKLMDAWAAYCAKVETEAGNMEVRPFKRLLAAIESGELKPEVMFAAIESGKIKVEMGPPIGPKERAHMPLSAVAHWIASEGGAISITADEKWWRPAFERLLAAIVSNRLAVVGRRSGLPETIPNTVFVGIPVAYPYSFNSLRLRTDDRLWTGDGPYLECQPFIDEANWQKTGGDKLFRSGRHARAEWTHLQVPSSAVARLWRFGHRRAAREERAATSDLATLLREQPGLTIENARRHCNGFGRFGRVVFKRIWQKARESAGLPAKASGGRPRKSGR